MTPSILGSCGDALGEGVNNEGVGGLDWGTRLFFPEQCDLLSDTGQGLLRDFSEVATVFTSAFPSDLQASFGGP